MKRFRALFFAVVAGSALTLLSAAVLAGNAPAAKAAALPRDSVYQLPLVLTDQSGQARDWRTRRGQPQLVSMFYTSCQFICPLIVDSGKAIDRSLTAEQRARLGVLLISMDPANDTPRALQYIVDKRQLDTRRWTLASPPPGDVRAVAGVLGIRYRQLADGNFNHTSALVLLDADGRILARTEKVGSRPDPEFIAAVRQATTP
ncbi:SCO family protein [Lysobacter yangpyeongensis]|uniref:SCO family protein n=1 Tax=Lysobacter yangpyeongensis TaxID=346182 RepID=A0ABW0SHY8_9GAMM